MKSFIQPPKPFDGVTSILLRRAEHDISYSAKRAIEMYIPVWQEEPAYYLFLKCAEHYSLCQGEIDKCKVLLGEFGMVEKVEVPKDWYTYHHPQCGTQFRGCHPTHCPARQYNEKKEWKPELLDNTRWKIKQPDLCENGGNI